MHKISDLLPPRPEPREAVPDFGCPRCGGLLLTRNGRYGDFIGCENFPECRYTEAIPGVPRRPVREMR